MQQSASVAGNVSCHPWDLGSIPRSPYNSHIIFPLTFLCSTPRKVHHKPYRSNKPGVFHANPRAQKARTPCAWSTAFHSIPRVKRAGFLMGPDSASHPPIWPKTPHGFALFSFYIYLSYFIFLSKLTINTINQLTFS